MSRKLLSLTVVPTLLGSTAIAEVPSVAVDIAPLHSLVAQVMEGIGEPNLIVQPGASPHEYNLRPSEAQALQDADLVFWIGEDLTPWLEDALSTLAEDATVTSVLQADGTELLEFRESALFEAHDHGGHEDEHDDHDEHDHDAHEGEHDEHDHDAHEGEHDEHDHDAHEGEHDEHDHDAHEGEHDEHGHHHHGDHDPHAWLSVHNAGTWLNVIAAELSAADPENAGTYYANAAAARAELEALETTVSGTLDPVRGGKFIVFHDAYQYFENDFDFPASGAISLGDASDPSPARIEQIQMRIQDEGVTCVLAEPQFNPGLVTTVLNGTDAKTAVLDPLGASLTPGADLYGQLLTQMADSLAECLSE